MILITDGGSTKCDWVLLDNSGNVVFRTTTLGLNPTVVSEVDLIERISSNEEIKNVFKSVKVLDFYGAGCGSENPKAILKEVLNSLFPEATVSVSEDMVAAVLSVTTSPGIVCILGTGSNSCYFDGLEIHSPIPSLGYILMDEASGNYFGKRLIRDYYYNKMPTDIASEFNQKYTLDVDSIKLNLYKKSDPNAYLASFVQFIFTYDEITPYFHKLIKEGITNFIDCRILCFKNAQKVPIHFIGSIAHFSKDIIEECFLEHDLNLGNIVQRPIEGLIEYYRNKSSN